VIHDMAFKQWVAETVASLGGDYIAPKDEFPPAPIRPDFGTYAKSVTSGVYFLMMGDSVDYVGQSRSVYSRIAAHMAASDFEFDGFVITECHPERLLELEAKFINEYKPKLNKQIPTYNY